MRMVTCDWLTSYVSVVCHARPTYAVVGHCSNLARTTGAVTVKGSTQTPRKYVFEVTSVGQRKYIFDVTSIGQRSSPWPCNSVKVEIKFHLKCKLHFLCAHLLLRLKNVSESFEAKDWVSWPRFDVTWIRATKLPLNSSFCAVTVDSKSRWSHGKKAYVCGVVNIRSTVSNGACTGRDISWQKLAYSTNTTSIPAFRLKAKGCLLVTSCLDRCPWASGPHPCRWSHNWLFDPVGGITNQY